MCLRSFLQTAKRQVGRVSPIRVVTGNQSADLDSVVSAIGYSYLNYKYDSTVSIPLINIPQDDFKLRRDIKMVLEGHFIDEECLNFLEDFNEMIKNNPDVELVLVDHCNLQGKALIDYQKSGKLKVKSIIDHHEDEQVFLDAKPRIITKSGSCSSLVFKYWMDTFDDDKFSVDSDTIKLFLAPLVIDTAKMTDKVESIDIEVFDSYQNHHDADTIQLYFTQIKEAKKDITGFLFNDLLRKDYKQFNFEGYEVGFSSVPKSIEWLINNYSKDELDKTLDQIDLDGLIITSSFSAKKQFHREIAFIIKNSKLSSLPELATPDLKLDGNIHKLEKIKSKLPNYPIFNQNNLAASRKQIVPVVKKSMSALVEREKL